jgi:hypothetical protein
VQVQVLSCPPTSNPKANSCLHETLKDLSIPLVHDRAAEGTKSFRVTLSNPTGGAVLGKAVATASIVGSYDALAPPFDASLAIQRDYGALLEAGRGATQGVGPGRLRFARLRRSHVARWRRSFSRCCGGNSPGTASRGSRHDCRLWWFVDARFGRLTNLLATHAAWGR